MEKYLHKLQPQIGEGKQFINVVLPLAQPNRRTNSKEEAVEQAEINVVVKRFCSTCSLKYWIAAERISELSGDVNGASYRCAALPLTSPAIPDSR